MYYTSNERDYFPLSADIVNSEKNINRKVNIQKYIYFTFIFQSSISHQIMSLTV